MDNSVMNGQLVTSLSSLLNDKKSVVKPSIVEVTMPEVVYTVDGKSYWYNHDALAKQTRGTIRELSEVNAKALGMHHTDDKSDKPVVDSVQPVAQSMVVPVATGGLVGLFLAWLKKRKKKRQKRFVD